MVDYKKLKDNLLRIQFLKNELTSYQGKMVDDSQLIIYKGMSKKLDEIRIETCIILEELELEETIVF